MFEINEFRFKTRNGFYKWCYNCKLEGLLNLVR